MRKQKYIIRDWAGNRMWPKNEFDTFEDAWEFIYEQLGDCDELEYQEYFVEQKGFKK